MVEVMLTTKDNPYDPFEQFTQWNAYDCMAGYNTCGYIARLAKTSDGLSDAENDEEVERVIDEIIKLDFMDIYRKVRREVPTQ